MGQEVSTKLGVRLPDDWGIEPVPEEKRRLRGFDLGVLWGDLAVSLLVMVAGTLLVPGLSTQMALLAIVVGTLLGTVLLALAGMIGSETGVPTMVSLRAPLGIRGSYAASGFNIVQLVGWAALEIIIMAQAARAMSEHYWDFSGYYVWLLFFGVLGTLMAVGGPVVVVRQIMQKFGVWIIIAASAWLTFYLFYEYDMSAIWNADGAGGFPNFWQGVDLVIALPISWLPLAGDYSRFARRGGEAAIGTYIGYAIANIWFFMLGMFYVQAIDSSVGTFIGDFVAIMLPLAAGWLAMIVLLFGETDEAFANIYSTAVSLQNLVSRVTRTMLTVGVGIVAIVVAISLDLIAYETFLFLIGGVFVPVFGIAIADFFVLRGRRYAVDDLYQSGASYWYLGGVNPVAIAVWAVSFLLYALAAQPPWLLEHADFVSWAPSWMTEIGGTIPAFIASFALYIVGMQAWQAVRSQGVERSTAPAGADGGS
jgi:putative hydroxymethylpyrimidine transporter CytX